MMTAAHYESGKNDKSDNNKDKVCLLLKDDFGGLCIRSRTRSHDLWSCEHAVTIAFLFGISSNK